MNRPAFNTSIGLDVNITLNKDMAMLLSDFIMTIAEEPDLLDILREFEEYEDGVPPQIYALASKLFQQVQANRTYIRNNKRKEHSSAVA